MAEPQPPSLNEELARVTGDQVPDLRALSNAAWFVFNPASVNATAITGDPLGYVAFGTQYFGVSVDWSAVKLWESTADRIDGIAAGLLTGNWGAEDARTLDALYDAVGILTNYLTTHTTPLNSWVDSAGVTDAGLGGNAVGLMVSALDRYATTMEGWHSSLRTASGVPLTGAIDNARVLLRQFNNDTAGSWAQVQGQGLRGRVRQGIETAIAAVRNHLAAAGIVLGTAGYLFDDWDPAANSLIVTPADTSAFHARAEATIRTALGSYPQGSLQSPATWTAINQAITASVTPLIEAVSAVARQRREALQAGYADLATGLAPSSGLGAHPGAAGPQPPPTHEGGQGGAGSSGGGGSAGGAGSFGGGGGDAGGPGEALAAAAVLGSGDAGADVPGAGQGGELTPPGPGFAGSPGLSVGLGVDPGWAIPLPTDAGAGSGALPGPVVGALGGALFAVGARSPATSTGPDGAADSAGAPSIGTAGVPLALPIVGDRRAGSRAVDPGGNAPFPAPLTANAGGAPLPSGSAGRALPAVLSTGLSDPPPALNAAGLSALDSRVGGGGQAGVPRPVEQIMVPASPASTYRSPGFWPPGMYGPSQTQFAGSAVPYGTAGGPGRPGAGEGNLRFRDRLRARDLSNRIAQLYGYDLGDHPYHSAGNNHQHQRTGLVGGRRPGHDAGIVEDELGRGRVVPDEGVESWSPPSPGSRPDAVVTPADDHETPDTFATVAAVGISMMVGNARRRDDDDSDDEYRDEPRRGLTDGVVDGGE